MSGLRRLTGIGTAASLTFALLAAGSVFAASAGPRQAQATGTRALRQTLDEVPPAEQSIVVSGSWASLKYTLGLATGASSLDLTPAALASVTAQLHSGFSTGSLRLAPTPADWAGMTSALYPVASRLSTAKAVPLKLEVAYRYPVAGHLRLVAGTLPAASPPSAGSLHRGEPSPRTPAVQVVVTEATAKAFGLRPGSRLTMDVPSLTTSGRSSGLDLEVTGIIAPADPGSSFWSADPLLSGPALDHQEQSENWDGALIADPGESGALQSFFGPAGLGITWELPVAGGGLRGQAQALFSQVNQITDQTPQLSGPLAPAATALTVSCGLLQPLAAFVQASDAVNVLLSMVYVGLAVAGIVMLLLACQMIATRRSAELTLYQARGASLAQVFSLGFLGAAVTCVPAAVLAWAAAVLLIPDAAPAGPAAWWPPVATVAIAATGPGAAAAWQHRMARRRRAQPRVRQAVRVVVELTACAAAIGAVIVSRAEAGSADLYTSAAPVLVAIPAVIVVLRLYQLLLRGLARASAGQRGVTGFLGLARAAQAALTLTLPAMTLVLAVTVAAFTGMIRDAVVGGETALSWQATGADAAITAPFSPDTLSSLLSPSAVRAITVVPGIEHAATALVVPLRAGDGQTVTAIAVDPAAYAALVASAPGYSPVSPALLTDAGRPGFVPVLASSQAAADLGGREGGTITAQQGLPALRVLISGELASTPALPAGGAFMVLPLSAIRAGGQPPPVNLMLLTGPGIDLAGLRAAVLATSQGAGPPAIITRSAALRELAGAPLQLGTFGLFTLASGYAAVLALTVMLLELALGAADRELTMTRLAAMGLAEGQRALLAAFELLPAIAAAAVAAIVCAVALPKVVAPAVNLSVFTQSQAPVPLRPDLASFLLPLAGLLAITFIALAYEIRSGRLHGVATALRESQ